MLVILLGLAPIRVLAEDVLAEDVLAEDAEKDLASIQAAYARLNRFSTEISFALYADESSETVEESGEAFIRRHGDLYWSRMFHLETLLSEHYLVLADHDSRTLMIDRRPEPSRNLPETISLDLEKILGESLDPDQLVSETGTIHVEPAGGQQRHLTIEYPSGEYQKIELLFDTKTYLIQSMRLYFRQSLPIRSEGEPAAPRIEIRYLNFQADPTFPRDAFSENRYFTFEGDGEFTAGLEYRDYRIINHLTGL